MMRTTITTAMMEVSTTPPKKPPNTPPATIPIILTPLVLSSFCDVMDTIWKQI